MSSVAVLIAGGVALILSIGYLVMIYNSLVQVRNNTDKAWKNIDVLLQQRHDEIPKLIETCKAYMAHERETLDSLTRLRAGYRQAPTVERKVEIENRINSEMRRLSMVWEQYPDLKAVQAFAQVLGRISGLESSIADRREFFNDSINIYNIQIERFPDVLLAKILSYQRKGYLEIPQEKKTDVAMNFA